MSKVVVKTLIDVLSLCLTVAGLLAIIFIGRGIGMGFEPTIFWVLVTASILRFISLGIRLADSEPGGGVDITATVTSTVIAISYYLINAISY